MIDEPSIKLTSFCRQSDDEKVIAASQLLQFRHTRQSSGISDNDLHHIDARAPSLPTSFTSASEFIKSLPSAVLKEGRGMLRAVNMQYGAVM